MTEYDALDSSKTSPGINVPVGPVTNGRAEGVKRASVGDTIIRKHDGTFEIFKQ